jgi:hypothetical protein
MHSGSKECGWRRRRSGVMYLYYGFHSSFLNILVVSKSIGTLFWGGGLAGYARVVRRGEAGYGDEWMWFMIPPRTKTVVHVYSKRTVLWAFCSAFLRI